MNLNLSENNWNEKLANRVVLVLGWVTGLRLHPTKTWSDPCILMGNDYVRMIEWSGGFSLC